jgi:hypothetical protein
LGDQFERKEMGGICSMSGEEESFIRGLVEKPGKRNQLENTGLDRMIILRAI